MATVQQGGSFADGGTGGTGGTVPAYPGRSCGGGTGYVVAVPSPPPQRQTTTTRKRKSVPAERRPGGARFIVLLDDGTGLNNGHPYGQYKTRAAADKAAQRAESVFPWCVGAYVQQVPAGYIHDPAVCPLKEIR